MTKQEFIASVEAKPNFIKWVDFFSQKINGVVSEEVEEYGTIQKIHRVAYITTIDGTNTYNVWFMHDTVTDEASWQEFDTMEPGKNSGQKKLNQMIDYLKNNSFAFIVGRYDLDNIWLEAELFSEVTPGGDLVKTNVLVIKQDGNFTHRKVV